MLVLMFWNCGGRGDGAIIGALCRQHDVDILLLAEVETDSAQLVTDINGSRGLKPALWELPRGNSRVRAFTRFTPDAVTPAFDDRHVKMLDLRPPIGPPILIVAAHLPSKLRADDDDQQYRVRQLRQDIAARETHAGHSNTLVIGDLNMNPFEDAMTAADGLHGVMAKDVASRKPRTVQGKAWDYFYNPMWSRLGDESPGPPGTYWYPGSGTISHFWNTFDQVLLRPGLLPYYDPAGLIVPDAVAGQPILHNGGGKAGLSDHLPIVLALAIEKDVRHG